jgi:hypothetical protein
MIRYIIANRVTWKEEPLDFVKVGPGQKMKLRASDSDRGTSMNYKNMKIKRSIGIVVFACIRTLSENFR